MSKPRRLIQKRKIFLFYVNMLYFRNCKFPQLSELQKEKVRAEDTTVAQSHRNEPCQETRVSLSYRNILVSSSSSVFQLIKNEP